MVVSDSVAVSGNIHLGVSQSGETRSLMDFMTSPVKDGDRTLLQKDVYKELRLRGYHYGGLFQGITQADLKGEGKMNYFVKIVMLDKILSKKVKFCN